MRMAKDDHAFVGEGYYAFTHSELFMVHLVLNTWEIS
jgi:hypothetical protein